MVRPGHAGGRDRAAAAGEDQHGIRVATALACWWHGGVGIEGAWRSTCRLDEQRLDRLAQALEEGPAAYRFDKDQRWTLARVAELIARLFHIRYTLRGVSYLLHRMGFSPQVPAHRAIERGRGCDRHLVKGGVAGGKR
jgi:hypothetical protein